MSQFEVYNPYHSQGLAAGGSALLDAINKGKIHLAKFILDAGEYDIVNTRDFKGKTPLIRACYIKEEKTRGRAVQLLLSKGANVNLRDEVGRTALSYACEMRCNDIVKILVMNNVNPDIPDIHGSTPLIYSSRVGNDTAIEILIRSFRRLGLSVDHVNGDGLSALLTAAKHGFIGCASLLAIEGRADLTLREPETGMNAEELARMRGCSNAEVLPFSPSANPGRLRLSRCGSLLTAKTSSSSSVGLAGSDGVDSGSREWKNIDPRASPSELTESAHQKAESSTSTTDTAARTATSGHAQWLLPSNSSLRRKGRRRRRHSMPNIPLEASTEDTEYHLPDQASLPLPPQDNGTSGVGCWSKTDSTTTNYILRAALGSRKSRELVRADTDVTRSETPADNDEDYD